MEDISIRLIEWYGRNRRDLPWRHTRDPYHIWISEVILQQTRVAQGYGYFLDFIRCFPTVEALAAAGEDEVLRCWQGLGYYSRARNLQTAARQIVEWGGFPSRYSDIVSLKGVGQYTAAAIASFAFDEPKAAVDGNVCRVWSRVFGVEVPVDTAEGKRLVGEVAQALLPVGKAAVYNQAVMEFGALQCVPRNPDCSVCPLADKCVALAKGKVAELPAKSHRTKVRSRYFSYLYVHDRESLVLHKRGGNDIWAGLYELPMVETGEAVEWEHLCGLEGMRQWLPSSSCIYKGCVSGVKHVLSHQVIHASFYELEVMGLSRCPEGCIIVPGESLSRYALPRLLERYLEEKMKKGG